MLKGQKYYNYKRDKVQFTNKTVLNKNGAN